VSELVAIGQRRGTGDDSLWVREGEQRLPGRDSNRRLNELHGGLSRHAGVRFEAADVVPAAVEATLRELHEGSYLEALGAVRVEDGTDAVLAGFAPPGLEPDIPVNVRLVEAAHEAVRTAIAAAERLIGGARFAYAVCRPPGHHAGPDWMAGYCYLNSAAAAAQTLRHGGLTPVGILDLDLHYPNGTSALVEPMPDVTLHSLHAAPVTNLPPGERLPRVEGERAVAFAASPDPGEYLDEVAVSVEMLAEDAAALVVSLGFDTVAGDPHGGWDFPPQIFTEVGALLAGCGLPVCVVQEGGYALESLSDCAYAFASGLLEPSPGSFWTQDVQKEPRGAQGGVGSIGATR
jgi:acetoin utilization deacetylase AcuC-like enzyme